MLNIEKYENELRKHGTYFAVTKKRVPVNCESLECNECLFADKDCTIKKMEWLLEEYKESILDDIEREYLSAVIKPFRKRIKSIKKTDYPSNSAFISIEMDKCEHIFLPVFELNSGMYQRMEINKEYTLEELGL
jgi:hypothetical protein